MALWSALAALLLGAGVVGVVLTRPAGSPGVDRPSGTPAQAAAPDCRPMPTDPAPRPTATAAPEAPDTRAFGVLGSQIADPTALRAAGVTSVTLALAWSRLEPRRGCADRTYLAEVRATYQTYRDAGLGIVLDSGLQYAPDWVFDLPGDTRFVDQHGEAWHGDVGADVPDAVFNPAVRDAQGAYLAGLGALLGDLELDAIRVGGLANNELHYPVRTTVEHDDSFWAFSDEATAVSPLPDYRPGGGTATQARIFLDWYLGSLDNYAGWLADSYRDAFGTGPTLQLLLPSWGIRPGDRTAAEESLLGGATRGEQTGALNEGLDWQAAATTATAIPGRVELYSTWLDAPDQGDDLVYTSPIRYLATVAAPRGLPLGGENTGSNDAETMRLCLDRAAELGLDTVFWFNAEQLADGGFADLADYAALIAGS